MNLTKEKEAIKKWAAENELKNVFCGNESSRSTYFEDANSDYIMEYKFDNILELEKIFEDVWNKQQGEKIRKIIAVSAFKNMPPDDVVNQNQLSPKIPQYIYTF